MFSRYRCSMVLCVGLLCGLMAGCGGGSSVTSSTGGPGPTPMPTPTPTPTPPVHSVAISWQTSTSPGVGFYNVYRSTVSGGPYTRVGWRVSGASYTDTAVQPGATYFYVVTSVTTSNVESTISSEIKATVPTP
jgi:hypothetical protein